MILHFEQNPGSILMLMILTKASESQDSTEQIAERKWIWYTDVRIEVLRGLGDEGTLAP